MRVNTKGEAIESQEPTEIDAGYFDIFKCHDNSGNIQLTDGADEYYLHESQVDDLIEGLQLAKSLGWFNTLEVVEG